MLSKFPPFKTSLLFLCALCVLCGEISAQWYTFPTYQEYVGYMEKWQEDHPQLAKLYDLGSSGLGTHRIYALRISDNVGLNEAEPRYVQTATIHGDALMGYIFSLHMIDTLLSSYGSDGRITELVNYAELWFFPLCHPDATYLGGDSTVMGAKAGIGNIDLNSNWPCPCMLGNHKYYGIYDTLMPEVAAIMKVHEMYRFNLHCDMHCGIESVIWPYGAVLDRACDEAWFVWAAERYVDQVHVDCGNNGYMTSGGDGINHFYAWYECHGTRTDFCTRFGQAKGFQIETSIKKIPSESDLRNHWVYDKEALFQYFELLYTGVQGVLTDALTKEPVNHVNVTAVNHDYDSAAIFTDSAGFYLRFIEKGTYSFTFTHPGYYSKTVDSVTIDDYSKKYELNVELERSSGIENTIGLSNQFISVFTARNCVRIMFDEELSDNARAGIYNIGGKKIKSFPAIKKSLTWDGRDDTGCVVSNGCYIVQVQAGDKKYCRSVMFFR